jgi:hypothetical protein
MLMQMPATAAETLLALAPRAEAELPKEPRQEQYLLLQLALSSMAIW